VYAFVVDHLAEGRLRYAEVSEPVPADNEALVRVEAVSINYGELAFGVRYAPDGAVLGYDAAGTVVRSAPDGSGPGVGQRVLTIGAAGGWAELRCVATDLIGVIPEGADLVALCAGGTAGATALRAVRKLSSVLAHRVLVTGASGGVGRLAVQLARAAGATVIAVSRDPNQGPGLIALGAQEVVEAPGDLIAPVFGVIDMVGGAQLQSSYVKLASGGTLVSVGHVADAVPGFDYAAMFAAPEALGRYDRSIVSLYLPAETGLAADLNWLSGEMARGRLDPTVTWRGDWRDLPEAAALLLAGNLHGKAALIVPRT
jgi:NADPH:quinone reductase